MLVKYVAYDRSGNRLSGVLEATSASSAEDMLWQSDLIVTKVRPVFRMPTMHTLFPSLQGTSTQYVVGWARQLATLLEAGVPLLTALQVLRGEQSNATTREALNSVLQSLEAGNTFADGLEAQPRAFPSILVRLVRIGEQTGELATMLQRSADYLESQASVRSKLRNTLAYPAVVIATSGVSVYILLTFTIPMLSGLLEEFNTSLPLITRILVNLGNFTQAWALRGLVLMVLLGLLLYLVRKRPDSRESMDRFIMKTPLLGPLIRANLQARVSQTISSLVSAGIPLLEAVSLARDNTDNLVMRRAMTGVRNDLLEGKTFSEGLANSRMFSPLLVEMSAVGERSGNLVDQLNVASNIMQTEFDQTVSKMVSSIEPIMIIGVGLVVGLIAVTVITTVYSVLPSIGS